MSGRACNDIRALFSERLDGILDNRMAARFDAHIASCRECAAEWRVYRRSVELVRQLPDIDPGEKIAFEVLRRCHAARQRRPLYRYAGSIAAVLMILVMAGPGERAAREWKAQRDIVPGVEYVDAVSLQPVEIDYMLHRAYETRSGVRLAPVVRHLDRHRREIVETAAYEQLRRDLSKYGDAASTVEIGQPIEVDDPALGAYVVAVDTRPR